MSDGHRLAQLMRKAGETPQNEIVDIVTGEVTSIRPLKVKIENRELTESFLLLGALCKETYAPLSIIPHASHTHTADGVVIESATVKQHEVQMLLWRGLKVGDRVLMLKVGRGQKYYIMQREEGVIST